MKSLKTAICYFKGFFFFCDMKIKNISLAMLFSLLGLICMAQESVNIKVQQGFETIHAESNQFALNKAPFKLIFHVKNLDGFCVGITQDEDIYNSAIGNADMEVMWFENTGMAEGMFNEEKLVTISDDAPNFWYFDTIDDHRFDRNPQGTLQEWLAERSVNGFFITELSDSYTVEDMVRPVYLVVYQPIYDSDYNHIDTKILYHAKLKWNK